MCKGYTSIERNGKPDYFLTRNPPSLLHCDKSVKWEKCQIEMRFSRQVMTRESVE